VTSVYSSRPSVGRNSGTWGGDDEAPKSEARRAENRGRRPSQRWSLGGGAASPSSPARGSGERYISSPSGVWGGAPAEIEFWHILA